MDKVTVIVPVFNTNTIYLNSCIKSILNQTYTNIEILIVDDGSDVETRQSCDLLSEKEKRIKVIHQNNSGVSSARNTGIINATGQYVMFVDSDDILLPDAINEAISILQEYNADIVIGAVSKIKQNEDLYVKNDNNQIIDLFGSDYRNVTDLMSYYLTVDDSQYRNIKKKGYISRGPISRLVKTEIVKNHLFECGLEIGEDVLWNMDIVSNCETICVVHNIWYGYVIYPSSTIRRYHGDRLEKIEKYMNFLLERHRDFCIKHMNYYAKNMAMEFYCFLSYELLSKQCPLSRRQKNKLVKDCLNKDPWSVMLHYFNDMPLKYKLFLILCRVNMWQPVLLLKRS